MLETEACWIFDVITQLPLDLGDLVINIGSSIEDANADSRAPSAWLIHNLKRHGLKTLNVDLKEGHGVDIVGDICSPVLQERLTSLKPRLVICANVLEHVVDVYAMSVAIQALTSTDCFLIVTVPRDYPYHPDPIDNGFRPSVEDLKNLFNAYHLVDSNEINEGGYLWKLAKNPMLFVRDCYLLTLQLRDSQKRRVLVENYRFLTKRFRTTCCAFRK